MDTNPQYRAKTDPKVDPNVTYETEIRNKGSSTGWIIGGLVVLALIAAFFMWGGSTNTPAPTTGTTTEQPATPTPTPAPEQPATPTQPQGGTTTQPTQPEGSTTTPPATPAPEQPATPTTPAPEGGTTGGTTGQGTTNP